jgi:hypothetical protein
VNAGTLSLGNGTSSSALSDFGGLAVVSPAVVNLNYTGSDAVLSLDLGGSPAAAGTWGATGSGAANINDTFFTGTGVINNLNGNTGLIGVLFWDGGTEDILSDGDAISAGGTGTWDNAILNWDSGTIAHAAWLNSTSATAYFGGTTGTVTLGADMNIGNMVLEVPDAGTAGYFIGDAAEDNTLTFGGDKTITVTATGANSSHYHTIRAGIAGSPTLNITGPNNNGMFFALEPPAGVTQTFGTINLFNTLASNKQLRLGGQSTGNVADAVTWSVTGNQLQVRKQDSTNGGPNGSSWTINQNINLDDGRIYVDEGTLIFGGTDNFVSHSIETQSGGRIVCTGEWSIADTREDFRVQSGGIVAPGGSVGTLTVNWDSTRTDVGLVDLQNGSTYEWEVASSSSTDVIDVQKGTAPNIQLVVGTITIKVLDAGGATVSAGDQLPVFTYGAGVTTPDTLTLQTNVTIDMSAVPTWTGTPTIVNDGAGTIYITGIDAGGGPANPFATWAAAAGLDGTPGKENGKADDPDGDGKNNLYEFAFNGDPLDGSDNGLIAGLVQDASAPAGNELTLVVAVRDGVTFTGSGTPVVQSNTTQVDGLTYTIQGTLDLATIPGSDVSHVGGPSDTAPAATGLPNLTGTDWEYHTFKLDASEGLGSKGFLRAKVADTP